MVLKLLRHIEEGPNPDLEISRHLTERCHFTQTPALAGWIEYRFGTGAGKTATLGLMHQFVPNQGDAWRMTLDSIKRSFEWALSHRDVLAEVRAAGPLRPGPDRAAAPRPGRRVPGRLHPARAPAGRAHGRPSPGPEPALRGSGLPARRLLHSAPALALPGGAHRPEPEHRPAQAPALHNERDGPAAGRAHRRPACRARRAPAPHPRPEAGDGAGARARRLPPRPGALHRQRLRHHRLRGRAEPLDRRPALQALAAARRRRHAALVPLRGGCRAAERARARRGRGHARAVGPRVVPLGQRGVPDRVPGPLGRGAVHAVDARATSRSCSTSTSSRSAPTSSATSCPAGPTGSRSRWPGSTSSCAPIRTRKGNDNAASGRSGPAPFQRGDPRSPVREAGRARDRGGRRAGRQLRRVGAQRRAGRRRRRLQRLGRGAQSAVAGGQLRHLGRRSCRAPGAGSCTSTSCCRAAADARRSRRRTRSAFRHETPPETASVVWPLDYAVARPRVDGGARAAQQAGRADLDLRGAPGLVAAQAGAGQPLADLPRAGAAAGRLLPASSASPTSS